MGELQAFPLGMILVAEVGSVGLGTAVAETSDQDELGVVVETPTQVLGLDERGFVTVMQRSRPTGVPSGPSDMDRTLHSLRRFCRLAAAGNPSILVAFYAPVVLCHPARLRLWDLGSAFIGRHVVPRYRGYLAAEKARVVETCDWAARVSSLDAELELLAGETAIAVGPDRARIERFLASEHRAFWESVGWL